MAKKVEGYIKLQIPAGKATPAPPVGPALGQHGVNIVEFTKQFNAKTVDQGDPVSYTHLDVYKRQGIRFSVSNILGKMKKMRSSSRSSWRCMGSKRWMR